MASVAACVSVPHSICGRPRRRRRSSRRRAIRRSVRAARPSASRTTITRQATSRRRWLRPTSTLWSSSRSRRAKGVANADAILGVPGIDVGFVGHTDLSVSLGIPGQFAHPDFIAARAAVVDCCRKHGRAAGCLVATPEAGRQWIAAGFRMVTYLGDIWLLGQALKSDIDAMRG